MAFIWGKAPNGRDMGVGIDVWYSIPGGSLTHNTTYVTVTFKVNFYTTYPTWDTSNKLHWWGLGNFGIADGSSTNPLYWSSSNTSNSPGIQLKEISFNVNLTGSVQNVSLGVRLEGIDTAGGNMSVTRGIDIPARPSAPPPNPDPPQPDPGAGFSWYASPTVLEVGKTRVYVNIEGPTASTTYRIYWRFQSTSTWNLLTETGSNVYSWIPPVSIGDQISGTGRSGEMLVERVLNGVWQEGIIKSVYFTVTPPTTPIGTGSFEIYEGNNAVSGLGAKRFLQGTSVMYISYSVPSPSSGSYIKKVEFIMGGKTAQASTSASTLVTSAFTADAISSGTMKMRVTDSSGATSSDYVYGIHVLSYTPPTISSLRVVRASDLQGTEAAAGQFGKVLVTAAASTVSGFSNNVQWRLRSRPKGQTAWDTPVKWSGSSSSTSGSKIPLPVQYVIPLGTGTYQPGVAYEFSLEVWDAVMPGSPVTSIVNMATEIVPLSISKDGIGAGKIWERGALDVGGDIFVDGSLHLTGSGLIPPGSIMPYVGDNAPAGWLLCSGGSFLKSAYPALASAIGTKFGTSGSSSYFYVPNLRGRVVVGLDSGDSSFYPIGYSSGEKRVSLSESEMPRHSHALEGYGGNGLYAGNPTPNWPSQDGPGYMPWWGPGGSGAFQITTMTRAGSGGSHNNLQPYMVMNYIIKT